MLEHSALASLSLNYMKILFQDNEFAYSEVEKMSSVQPTMWLGSQSG